MSPIIDVLLTELLSLHRAYTAIPRAIITRERKKNILESGLLKELDLDHPALREPLMEHVGHLPIIATFLHPHIEHSAEVNLGRSLIMLAIHDIGETKLGEIFIYKKSSEDEERERSAARTELHTSLIPYFDELVELETYDAKYAHAIDQIAPILHQLDLMGVTLKRFEHFGFGSEEINKLKRKNFIWDRVLVELFDLCIEKHREAER